MFDTSKFYGVPFLLGLGGSLMILFLQAIRNKEARKKLALFFLVQMITISLFVGISLLGDALNLTASAVGSAMVVFPMIPLGYIYAIYHRQLADIRFRSNPLVVVYLFVITFTLALYVILGIVNYFYELDQYIRIAMFTFALFAAFVAVWSYGSFSQWAEKKLFGIHLPSDSLIHEFTRRVSTSLSTTALAQLVQSDVLPSMMIRQSVLLVCDQEEPDTLYHLGVESVSVDTLPDDLRAIEGISRWMFEDDGARPLGWVRLAIPLMVEEHCIGLWLFGEHDPDDFYSKKEIATLETLAAPIAIALQNIHQARRLRVLYQVNLKQLEQQRSTLGHDLHDAVLNNLSKLVLRLEDEKSVEEINRIIDLLRDVIAGLRPPVLDYGLRYGLYQLSEDLRKDTGSAVQITFDMEPNDIRYHEVVELQLYYIVKQACDNALRHAKATHIHISGELSSDRVALDVSDDGVGFVIDEPLDILPLLDTHKFGLAGMLERAELVRATLEIDSSPGAGTRVHLSWQPEVLREEDIQFLRF